MAGKSRRQPAGVRSRATVLACVTVGAIMILLGVIFLALLRQTLVEEVDDATTELVRDIGFEVAEDALPDLSAGPTESDVFVQVVDRSGRVTESSPNVVGKAPVARPAAPKRRIATIAGPVEGLEGDFRVAALLVKTDSGPVSVYAGRSLEGANHDISVARTMLAMGVPVVVALVGLITWLVVGRALKPVEEATERQRRFVDDASHELRSPLSVLRAELEVALAGSDKADWPAVATRLLGDVARQERLVDDLLFDAKAEHSAGQRPVALVDLDGVVFEEVERIRIRSSIPIDTTSVSAAPVRGRADDLARVVANLLENAVRHARTSVKVTVGVVGSFCELVVHDDGPGIPDELRDRVFERFARIDRGRSRGRGGAGLGLAIARQVVEAHGGRISVEDAPVGARIAVRLPAHA